MSWSAQNKSNPPGPPQADMAASAELQAWLARLEIENRKVGKRNLYLALVLVAAVGLLLVVLRGVYQSTIGAYAQIADVRVEQHPVDQGRLQIRFDVFSPGKVYCRRTSGGVTTDLIDHFSRPCKVDRPWSWGYRPGDDIELTLWYRRGWWPVAHRQRIGTQGRADIVILIDTTGSMSPSIAELKQKCVTFAEQLERQALQPRFALIGFGDAREGPWLDVHEFTSDASEFRAAVGDLERFDGGDFPESALDALEEALTLPFDERALRHFYLVTDAEYHVPSKSGATAEQIAAALSDHRVMLWVFSQPKLAGSYEKLLGDSGRFGEIESFGKLLSEGRILGD